jgi:CheY-like chemotaxis protein
MSLIVLSIDDDPDDQFFIRHRIEKEKLDIKLTQIDSAEEAIGYLNESINGSSDAPFPDVILLDINMPRMNGFEFLDHIEKNMKSETSKMVIIMLSASLNQDDKAKAESFDRVKGYLSKPLQIESFKAILAAENKSLIVE